VPFASAKKLHNAFGGEIWIHGVLCSKDGAEVENVFKLSPEEADGVSLEFLSLFLLMTFTLFLFSETGILFQEGDSSSAGVILVRWKICIESDVASQISSTPYCIASLLCYFTPVKSLFPYFQPRVPHRHPPDLRTGGLCI
jgi:hypothetical protein